MKKKFLPIILGTDANAYGLARSFHEEYGIKSLALGVTQLIETKNSKIIDTIIYKDLKEEKSFIKILTDLAEEYKKEYENLILLSCAEWYTDLIVDNFEILKKYYILPFMNKELKKNLENKESFYNLCKKYALDYPETFIVTKENYKSININHSYPLALKPSSSSEYSKIEFAGKEKSYKIKDEEELKNVINKIYNSNYKDNIIVQDYIPGNDDTMWVMICYSDKNGKVKMMCLGHCILEEHTPYGIGNYKAIISDGNKELYEKIKSFLEKIKYIGFSNFDLKYDYRDKKYKLFEMNIRQGRSSFFTTAAGLNLSKFIVEDYIENKNEKTVYNYNKHLWLTTPKQLLKKYVYNKDVLKEATNLIKQKKYSYTLKYKKDRSIYRLFWTNRIYLKDYKLFKLYPPKDDE